MKELLPVIAIAAVGYFLYTKMVPSTPAGSANPDTTHTPLTTGPVYPQGYVVDPNPQVMAGSGGVPRGLLTVSGLGWF